MNSHRPWYEIRARLSSSHPRKYSKKFLEIKLNVSPMHIKGPYPTVPMSSPFSKSEGGWGLVRPCTTELNRCTTYLMPIQRSHSFLFNLRDILLLAGSTGTVTRLSLHLQSWRLDVLGTAGTFFRSIKLVFCPSGVVSLDREITYFIMVECCANILAP